MLSSEQSLSRILQFTVGAISTVILHRSVYINYHNFHMFHAFLDYFRRICKGLIFHCNFNVKIKKVKIAKMVLRYISIWSDDKEDT